jgi:hypothetical protein
MIKTILFLLTIISTSSYAGGITELIIQGNTDDNVSTTLNSAIKTCEREHYGTVTGDILLVARQEIGPNSYPKTVYDVKLDCANH